MALRTGRGRAAGAIAVLLASLTACSGPGGTDHGRIRVNASSALADQAVDVTVTGLVPGQQVTVTAQASDADGRVWRAQARFTADPRGDADLGSSAPVSGSYSGADGMGLFWSMTTLPGEYDNEYFTPAQPQNQPGLPVRLTVTSARRQLAARTVTRYFMAPGETARVLALPANGVAGVLFLPPPGTARHPGVLAFGGAEGGMSQTWTAALLAAHGYPALTVAYFAWPGLPDQLRSIPLEYFVTAGRILASQSGVDPAHLLVMGYSRGTEAALLLADDFPRLFHGAIVYSPSYYVNPSQVGDSFDSSEPGWTLGGQPVLPGPIPMEQISGPVLAIAGDSDAIWDSEGSASKISTELSVDGSPFPHQALIYPNAGHGVGTYPFEPIGNAALEAVGGTRAGDVAAQRSGWAKVMSLLAGLGS
jgi:dienelactone hydrolase